MNIRITVFFAGLVLQSPAFAGHVTSPAHAGPCVAPDTAILENEYPLDRVNIKYSGRVLSAGNATPSAFSNAFIFPDFIEESLKNEVYKRLKPENHFGAEFTSRLTVGFRPNARWKEQYLEISHSIQQFYATQFSEDLFRVVFGGNAAYAGKEAVFDHSAFYSVGYQTLKLAVAGKTPKVEYKAAIGLAKGAFLTDISIGRGGLYSQENGEYLDMRWQGVFRRSTAASNPFFGLLSLGPVLDLRVRTLIGRLPVTFTVSDLGFIDWNRNTSDVHTDTLLRFSGIPLNRLINANDSTVLFGDSLLNIIRGVDAKGRMMTALPTLFSVKADKKFGRSSTLSFMLAYRYIIAYRLLSGIEFRKQLRPAMAIRVGAYYGGFGRFQTAAEVMFRPGPRHYISIGTVYNEGFINPGQWSGNGLQLKYYANL